MKVYLILTPKEDNQEEEEINMMKMMKTMEDKDKEFNVIINEKLNKKSN